MHARNEVKIITSLQRGTRDTPNSKVKIIILQRGTEEKARCLQTKPGAIAHTRRKTRRSEAKLKNHTQGRLRALALTLLVDLADQEVSVGGPGLSRAAFISRALRELSVAVCPSNASLCRSGAYVATRAAGQTPMRGLTQPSPEVVLACVAPHVWVWCC
jgi:hypothetical protein